LRNVFGLGGISENGHRNAIGQPGTIGQELFEFAFERSVGGHRSAREAYGQGIHLCPTEPDAAREFLVHWLCSDWIPVVRDWMCGEIKGESIAPLNAPSKARSD
jgi:hypothetical protein